MKYTIDFGFVAPIIGSFISKHTYSQNFSSDEEAIKGVFQKFIEMKKENENFHRFQIERIDIWTNNNTKEKKEEIVEICLGGPERIFTSKGNQKPPKAT